MRKILTLAAAVLASVSLWADVSYHTPEAASETFILDNYLKSGGLGAPDWWIERPGSVSSVKCGDPANNGAETTVKVNAYKIKGNSGNSFKIAVTSTDKVIVYHNSHDQRTIQAVLTPTEGDPTTIKGAVSTLYTEIALDKTKSYQIAINGIKLSDGSQQDLYCYAIKLETTSPAEAICPSGLSISGGKMYAAGAKIELTASLEAGNGAITYQWYKGSVADANKIAGATAAKLEIANCAVSDAGNYFCVASKAECDNAVNAEAYAISVKDPATIYGEIINATLTSATSATVSGAIGGTADVSLSSSLKVDKGKYFGIALASGNFKEGDTVVITMTTAGGNYPCLFSDKERTNCLYLATAGSSDLVYKIVLPAAANSVNTLYVSRGDDTDNYKWNPVLSSMAVIRPVPVKSTVETLTAVTVNDVAISAANLAELQSAKTLILEDSYLNAPVVKFTKHVVVTYEDDSTKESDEVIEKTASQATASTWGASATIGGNAYAVYTVKQFSYVVTYKLGEQTLGSENVSANGSPAEYAQYQSLSLATFEGWYSDADLAEGHKVANIAAEVITEAKTFYAKFTYLYAESVNIEQLVLDNGVGYDLMALMGTKHYASNWTNDLDSLNDEKTARNYAFLGQKVKAAGKMLDLRLPASGILRVKFGNVGATPQVSINKGEYADMQIVEGVYTYEASASAYISIKTVSSSTVVFKQIMINEAIADVTLPSSGTATAIENAAVEAKATKRIVNGQVIIVRDGKTYNALGAEVR